MIMIVVNKDIKFSPILCLNNVYKKKKILDIR